MKKDTKQILFLAGLSIAWLVSWRINRLPATVPRPVTKKVARETAQESPLTLRFKRIRAETDALYHYRLKPIPFSFDNSPFRLPLSMQAEEDQPKPPAASAPKSGVVEVSPAAQAETGEALLRKTVQSARIGGVVTMNGVSQLNVNGELHKEGEVFSARVGARLILVKIKKLTTTYAIMALDDPESGGAEMRIKLN